MRFFAARTIFGNAVKGTLCVALIGAGISLFAAPAKAWRCWGCGPHVVVGLGFYAPPPPPVYYAPPPVYYAPPPPVYYTPPPAVVQAVPSGSCTSGQWRQQDGSIVNGVACQQPDGTWRLQ